MPRVRRRSGKAPRPSAAGPELPSTVAFQRLRAMGEQAIATALGLFAKTSK